MKRIDLYKLFLTVLFAIPCVITLAQENKSDTLRTRFNKYVEKNLEEKIYVHTDRDGYVTGETIWFTVYVTDALHRPLSLSKVVYVEVLDRNKAVVQAKISVKEGIGSGSLFLPATLVSDNYQFRAYSNWMKNYSADFYFHKTISIVNPFVKLDTAVTNAHTKKIETQFFPEGGMLIAGVSNKVAFKVNNESGHGLDFKGTLIDQNNDTILHFSPLKFGIGSFSFIPMANTQYRAVIHLPRLKKNVFDLPSPQTSGYAFHLEDSNDKIKLEVSPAVLNSDGEIIYLLVHAHQVISKVEMNLAKGKAVFYVNKNDLAEGISHFTVFNHDLKPVCERLYFKPPTALLPIEVQSNQQEYRKREKVSLQIEGGPNDRYSIAVVRKDSLSASSGNISDYFYLSSDLKGEIESPEYYLNRDSLTLKAQDNLMLTHGWSRFKWDTVLKNESTLQYPLEFYGHLVSGIIKDETGVPQPGIVGYASSPSKIIRLSTSLSNRKGEVFFDMKNFFGTRQLILQTNRITDSLYHIELKSPFSSRFASGSWPMLHLNPTHKKSIVARSVGMQVQDVHAKNENNKTVNPNVDSISFYGRADETYFLDSYTRFPVMEEVMREYVPGVMVRKHKDGFHFIVLDNVKHGVFRQTPLVLLDGVPLFDEDEIMNFDPLKVKKLEVMTSRYFLGAVEAGGIVSYTTYRGDLGGFQLNPKCVVLNYDALQLQQEFYSPQYEITSSRLPDFRSLLYWNPSVRVGSNGKETINFFTSDLGGKYQVIVQGVSASGVIGNKEIKFTVKE